VEKAPLLAQGKLAIDISNVTYADMDGTRILREIYSQNRPRLIATTPWTQYLAEKIAADPHDSSDEEQENADND
jgi:hypothetical protein